MTEEMLEKHHVPILDEHDLTDKKGNVVISLDQKILKEIADVNNQRISETGDLVPLVIGHTKDDAPENQQPEIVGYASNFSVEPFFKTGKKCITATFKFFKHSVDKVKKFPRRSIELWLSDYKIDPISLLGATTPERDLGLLQLNKHGVKKYKRTMDMDNKQEIVDAVLSALQQTDVWQFLTQLASQSSSETGAATEGEMQGEATPPEAPPEASPEAPPEGGDEEIMEDTSEEQPSEEQPVQAEKSGEEPVQYQRTDRIKLSRLESENTILQKELQTIKLKFQRAEREKDLIELEAEGYLLDRSEELSLVESLPEEKYRSHLNIIRKRYQKAPLGSRHSYVENSRSGSVRGRTKDEVNGLIDYATRNGITYAEALEQVNAEKVY